MNAVHSKPVRFAAAAYQAALAGKWDTAAHALRRLSDECGGEGVNTALIGWCDTYLDHATDGHLDPAGGCGVYFIRGETGQLDKPGSDRVPPAVQWAGRLISARAAMDEGAWGDALDALPTDDEEMSAHVVAVLRVVAWTVNGLPRGFARMGGAS